jgi:hypothetical protein
MISLITISKMSDDEVKEAAKLYKVELPPALKDRDKMNRLVYDAAIKFELDAESKAKAELVQSKTDQINSLGQKTQTTYSSPESKAIEASKKVYALFRNMANPGFSESMNIGCVYTFKLYDEKVHILPEWLITYLTKTMASVSEHAYREIKNPVTQLPQQVRSGVSKRKFFFQVLSDAPSDSEFGVVIDNTVLKKFNMAIGDELISVEDINLKG